MVMYTVYIGVLDIYTYRLHRGNGKENGNYYKRVCRA